MRLKNGLLVGLFLLLPFWLTAQSEGIPFITKFTAEQYGGGIQNWAITQNREGLIYVANNFGLLEYDGSIWNKYPMPNSAKIRDVSIGENGKIYVASQGDFGYYLPNRNGLLTFYSLADSLPEVYRNFDEAWRVFESGEELIFCTFNQLFIFKPDKEIKIIPTKSSAEDFFFIDHKLYIQKPSEGLFFLRDGKIQPMPFGDAMKDKSVTGMIPFNEGSLLVTTLDNGIYLYQPSTGFDYWRPEKIKEIQQAGINQLLSLKSGNIAIGTQNQGIFILNREGKLLYHLNKEIGLDNRTVLSMYEDVQGNLWLGHNNGISSIELQLPFTLINEDAGLPGTGYDGFTDGKTLYFGTNNGVYTKSGNNYEFLDGSNGQVYSISQAGGVVTIGHHKGAFQIEEGKLKKVSNLLGYWTFRSIGDDFVIGGNYQGMSLFQKTQEGLKFLHKIDGLDESSRVMEKSDNQTLWMTQGYKGVYQIRLDEDYKTAKVKFYGTEQGLPSNILINVWNVTNRLVFSTEKGIYRYDSGKDRFLPDEFFGNLLGKDIQVSYLEEDLLGNIYYVSQKATGILEKLPNGLYKHETQVFNRIQDLLNDDLLNLSILDANQVLFGAKEGFILFDKSKKQLNDVKYHALIREVKLKDSVIANSYRTENDLVKLGQAEKTILPYAQNDIQFRFSAPFFQRSQRTLYQHKLIGADSEWSNWDKQLVKEYTNLPEGKYTFTVRAKNIYEQLSEPASFEFRIYPPWYRSIRAFAFYGLLVLVLLLGFYSLLNSKFKREKRRITINQEKKISTMDRELRSSEEELQRVKNEKLESEVISKNKKLTLSTMHLLNKNSFINSMKHDVNMVVKKSKNQETKKELSRIINNINKNIEGDEDWNHFAIHFDQVHGDFTKRIASTYPDMTAQEMKLAAYLKMNLSTKEIAHLLSISVRGVEIARYRLRKRLELERKTNLQEFILNF
ncbi:MAG: ligand-binding sensor domain-containing protein/DNA-binding CsgD family transcriptional regulator [Arenicella sp.]|jgi:ligand-binding sensor domain-containing protein/DNA-binding CsgD family transcriptional regulator